MLPELPMTLMVRLGSVMPGSPSTGTAPGMGGGDEVH